MGETVILYSALAICSAIVAAMGFKVSGSNSAGISLTQMVEDLSKATVPGVKLILGTVANQLVPGSWYGYMQVVNGKTCVPQNLISWIQDWLNTHEVYDKKSATTPDYETGQLVLFSGQSLDTVIAALSYQIPSSKAIDFTNLYKLIDKYSIDLTNKLFSITIDRYSNGSYSIILYVYNGPTSSTPGIDLSKPQTVLVKSNGVVVIPKKDTVQNVHYYRTSKSGEFSDFGNMNTTMSWMLKVSHSKTNNEEMWKMSSFGPITISGNDTGFEAGENVPGKDIVIPGKGIGELTNPDIVGWLQSAVGAAVASALGIGTAELDYVPVAVKNPALTGDITGALENVIDQAQDIAQAGDTAADVIASGEKYGNISLAPSKPSGNISASALYTIWNPSQSQLNKLASFLWSTDFVDTIKKILQSPMDALISLALFPVNPPTDGTHNIALGYIDSGVAAPRVADQFMTVQTSGLVVPHKYNSYLDYAPYTRAEIFLPFIGFQPININDIMGKSVDVVYNIDLLSGVCTAIVHANGQSLYSYSGNMAMFLPLSAGNWARMLTPIFGMVGGIATMGAGIGGVISGAPLLASTSMSVRGAESIGNLDGNSVSRSGGISGNAGIMGDYQPFIVVTRPINDKPSTYDSNIGQTYNKSARLGTLSGFTVVEEAHIEGMNATEDEKQEIERLLKEGVIL